MIVYKLSKQAKPVKKFDMYTSATPATPNLASYQLSH